MCIMDILVFCQLIYLAKLRLKVPNSLVWAAVLRWFNFQGEGSANWLHLCVSHPEDSLRLSGWSVISSVLRAFGLLF